MDAQKFVKELMSIGILSYNEHERLWHIAKRCAVTGVVMGAGTAKLGAGGGTVALPGIGTISGATAGFLAGLVTGTASCVAINVALRDELKQLANGE